MKLKRIIALSLLLAIVIAVVAVLLRQAATPRPVLIPVGIPITEPEVYATETGDALILAPDGTVWGWGINQFGAILGKANAVTAVKRPQRLDVGSNWVQLAVGHTIVAGIKTDGSLWGWSYYPSFVQRGMGAWGLPPSQFGSASNWTSVAVGAGHVLALTDDGRLFAWGQNKHGQIGNGSTENVPVPTQVGQGSNWVSIAAGSATSLGLQLDGSVWQWGTLDIDGARKDPYVYVIVREPTLVDESTNWVRIGAGPFFNIGEKRDGNVWVWGSNAHAWGSTNKLMPMQLGIDPKGELLSVSFAGAVLRMPNGTWRFVSAEHDLSLLEGGEFQFSKAWASTMPSVYFGLTNDGTLWTWGTRLGVDTKQPVAEFINGLVGRIGIRPKLLVRSRPPSAAEPWPIARFVTNTVPDSSIHP